MSNSIVHIESSNKENRSFGTGFVIESNQQGTYILTCQHVLDSVVEARINSKPTEVIAQNSFLDMAILFLPNHHFEKMQLQLKTCNSLHITTIAFSSFKEELVQKSTIHATLFEDFIELHSTEDDTFYLIKKLKADKDYNFSRGNSGAPIICKETGNVIAMLSNREGSSIAYAIGVSCIKSLLEELYKDDELMKKHKDFYLSMSSFKEKVSASVQAKKNPKNKIIYHIRELKEEESSFIPLFREKLLKIKYFLLGILFIFALYGAYSFFGTQKERIHPIYYSVTNLPPYDTLNVRAGAGKGYRVVGELFPNTKHIIVTHCKNNDEGSKWCYIKYKDIKGWVHSYYIEREPIKHIPIPDHTTP